MPDTLQSIRERYSSRGFTGEALRAGELQSLMEAALAAPSAMNKQPWRILALTDKALIDEIDTYVLESLKANSPDAYERIRSRGGKVFYNAPAILYIFREESPHSLLDCGIAAQNIALAAHALGLGSVICGMAGIALPAYRERLQVRFPSGGVFLPADFAFATSVLVGHSAVSGQPHPLDLSKAALLEG